MANIDLGSICESQMNEIVGSGLIQKTIRSALEQTVKATIESELCGYCGTVKKDIEQAIKESVKIDRDKLDLPEYNNFIVLTVKECVEEFLNIEGKNKLAANIEKMLKKEVKPEYTLEEIIEEFKGYYGGDKDNYEEFTLVLNKSSVCSSLTVSIDEESDKDAYKCDIRFMVDSSDNHIYGLHFKGESIAPMDAAQSYGFENFMLRLLANDSKIIIKSTNVDDYNLYFKEEDY